MTENCGAFPCATTGCAKTCMTQTDCSGTAYCKIVSGTSGTCTAKNPNGTAATNPFECTSNIVADGVCCDTTCTGCKACSGAPLTGGAVGQCSNIVAGKVAHSACTNSGTVCGLDGLCDGAGACELSPKQGASCDSASNKCLTGAKCQAGACAGAVATTCPAPTNNKCQVASCTPATGCGFANAPPNTSCDDGNGCTIGDLCQNGACTPGSPKQCNPAKLCLTASTCSGAGVCSAQGNVPDGTSDPTCPSGTPNCLNGACVRCTRDNQCNTGELCNPTTHTCGCRKPTTPNQLGNAGFDAGLSLWTNTYGVLATDSEGCAASYSGYVESTEYDPWQCAGPVTQGATYYVGGKFKGPPYGSMVRLHFWSGANCSTAQVSGGTETVLYLPGDTDWAPHSMPVTAPPGAVSVDVAIYGAALYFDQMYFGPVDNF